MKVRTQILLETRQYQSLKELAAKDGVSLSETIRRIVREHFDRSDPAQERMWGFVGAGADPRPDVSLRHDDYLAGLED